MKFKSAILLAGALILLISPPAMGWQLSFQPRITFGVEYTDNVFLDSDAIPEEPDEVPEIPEEPGDEPEAPPETPEISEPEPTIQPESDIIFITAPGFTLEMLGQQTGMALDYDFGYTGYEEFTDNNSWRHDLTLTAWTQLTRNTRLELRNSFLYTEDPLGGRAFEVTAEPEPEPPEDPEEVSAPEGEDITPTDATTVSSREPYWVNTADLQLTQNFGPESSWFAGFNYSMREDDSTDGEDSQIYTPRIGVTHWFGQFWGAELEGDYIYGEYDESPDVRNWNANLRLIRRFSRHFEAFFSYRHSVVDQRIELPAQGESPVDDSPEEDEDSDEDAEPEEETPEEGVDILETDRRTLEDYQTYNPEIGISYSISNDLSLSASAGFFYYDPDYTESYHDISGHLDLTKTFRRGNASIYGATGYNTGFDTRGGLGSSQYYEAGVAGNYQVTRYLTMNAFASYHRDDYPEDQGELIIDALYPPEIEPPTDLPSEEEEEPEPEPESVTERTDNTYGAGIGLTYAPLAWVSCTLNYEYRRVDSDEPIDEYDENRATFYVTFTTPRPWRTER